MSCLFCVKFEISHIFQYICQKNKKTQKIKNQKWEKHIKIMLFKFEINKYIFSPLFL